MRKPTLAPGGHRRTRTIRSTAALLGALLAFGSLAPPLALAKHEHDTEGEGTSAPGTLPGLEIGIGQEPAGEETTLSEEAVGSEESEVEEEVPAPEVEEAEPEAIEVAPPPSSEPPPLPEPEVVVPVEVVPTETAAPTEPPSYGTEASPPAYETSPSAPPSDGEAVVQNEAIPGPAPQRPAAAKKNAHPAASASPHNVVEPEPAPETPVAPQPEASPPALIPATAPASPGSLTGKKRHLVAAGDCLWFIAEGYLPAGASNSEIAAEVHHLWRLNSERIGTGDPNSLPVGVKLRLS